MVSASADEAIKTMSSLLTLIVAFEIHFKMPVLCKSRHLQRYDGLL
jgi:hypothetical protein